MKRSLDRILTTHTGSLSRTPRLLKFLLAKDRGEEFDRSAFETAVAAAVSETVRGQITNGVDIVNDGEQSKIGFAPYVKDRLEGFGGPVEPRPIPLDEREFPEYTRRRSLARTRPTCDRPVSWKDFSEVERDIRNLQAALEGVEAADAFMTAASPGTIANFFANAYYASREDYLFAIAEVMRREYEAIVRAGFLLQLDCPDLALRGLWFPDLSLKDFRKIVAQNIEALNYAVRDIPSDSIRLHVCWGAAEGPHNNDLELRDIVDLLLTARPAALSFVGSNGRHEHEWRVWQEVDLPGDKILIPGVIDSTTNIIEHPEVVAERILRFASTVGRERVIAGVDCGLATTPTADQVDSRIAWAKLRSLSEGAELASAKLWHAKT